MQIGISKFIENLADDRDGGWSYSPPEFIRQKFHDLNHALPSDFLPNLRLGIINDSDIILTENASNQQLVLATTPPFLGLIEITDKPIEVGERIEIVTALDVIGFSLSSKSASVLKVAPLLCASAKSLFEMSDHSIATMELAIQEATINALAHGNLGLKSAFEETGDNLDDYYALIQQRAREENFKNKRIDFVLWQNKNDVFAAIGDQGTGYKPLDRRALLSSDTLVKDRRRITDRRQSGRGLDIIRQFACDCWISTPGNSVAMRFNK